MSPRAAWRLESLGFVDVYEYAAGKLDWLAAGLPTEGTNAEQPRAGDLARKDVPTCEMHERLSEVAERVETGGWTTCIVVNSDRIVLGILRSNELGGAPASLVEQVMRPGPSTFRPFVSASEMAHYMTRHDLPDVPITTSDGRLLGLLVRDDAIAADRGELPT